MEKFGQAMSFIGPLLGEGVSLLGRYLAANAAEKAVLIEQRDSAIAEMRSARAQEEADHAKRMADAEAEIKAKP